MSLQIMMLSEEARDSGLHIACFHLYEMSKTCKCRETESCTRRFCRLLHGYK